MKTIPLPHNENRRSDKGAILIVVLIVMIALLGLGMTGLFLTSGSIQMNTNINLRSQALVVAEAGLERARSVLNSPNWIPPISSMLAGSNSSSGDEISTSVNDCQGSTSRGAILVDQITAGCTGSPTPAACKLQNVTYLPISRSADLPSAAGTVTVQAMGKYTVYIRQDQADCRMGNFVCENTPVPSDTVGAGGSSGPGGASGAVTSCTVPSSMPPPNGAVIIRSEGVASDNRTRVVLEVTLAPSQGANKALNTPLSALCAAGANGCDDNSSVQNGIVVNSPIAQTSPTSGGAGGAGGIGGGGGGGGPGGVFTSPTGTTGGSPGTAGMAGSGGTGGSGGQPGTGGSPTCSYDKCNVIATLGIPSPLSASFYPNTCNVKSIGTDLLYSWLGQHSTTCATTNIDIGNTTITDALLAPFKIIVVLDLYHNVQDLPAMIAARCASPWPPSQVGHQRLLTQPEIDAVLRWVNNGGGLMTTTAIANTPPESVNVNSFLKPYGFAYSAQWSNLSVLPFAQLLSQSAGELVNTAPNGSAILAGVSKLRVTFATALVGWSNGAETALPANSSSFITFAQKSGYPLGVGAIVSPHTPTAGRILAWGDEWITYDEVWSDNTEQAGVFWENVLQWLAAPCNASHQGAFPDPTKWYKIATKTDPNQCLDVSGGNYSNTDAIQLWTKLNVNQEFQFKDAGYGYYTITARGNPAYSINMGGNYAEGQTLLLWSTDITDWNEKFKLVPLAGGYYRLETVHPTLSIDSTGNIANGAKPHLWTSDDNNDNQKWVISEVP
jgi:Tfp pilus assembly protein PilX